MLLQVAFKINELEVNGNYAAITLHNLPNLYEVVTELDSGLNRWFPTAENLNNLGEFHTPDSMIGPMIADPRAFITLAADLRLQSWKRLTHHL